MTTTKKIEKLTPDQEQDLVAFREEWRAIGLRTGHDEARDVGGKAAVVDAYRAIGREAPALVLWAASPLQAVLMGWVLQRASSPPPASPSPTSKKAIAEVAPPVDDAQLWGQLRDQLGDQLGGQLWGQLRDQLGDQLRDQLRDQLGDQLRGQLGGQLGDQLWGQLGGQLGDQLWDQLGDQLWDQLGGQLRDQLRDQLWDQLGDQLGDQLWDQLRDQLREIYSQSTWFWGQCEAYWTAWYRFGHRIGVKITEEQDHRLGVMERLARSAFMVMSWGGVTILVEHPIVATFDDRRRLHAVDGPALAWRDGYGVFALHGIRVEEKIARRQFGVTEIREQRNAEVRRVMVDLYNDGDGGRYLRDAGAIVVHEDKDMLGFPRRLLRIDLEGDEPLVAIELHNSTLEPDGTRKLYTLRVDPELRPLLGGNRKGKPQELTCENAVASTFGLRGREYQLSMES